MTLTDLRQIREIIRALPDGRSLEIYSKTEHNTIEAKLDVADAKALVAAYSAATEWVDVADRLPEVGTTYFARRHDGCIDVGTVSEGMCDSGYWQGLYVAWMPIPPYQHKSEGDSK